MKRLLMIAGMIWAGCVAAELTPPSPPVLKPDLPLKATSPKIEEPKLEAPTTVEKPELNEQKIVVLKSKTKTVHVKHNGAEQTYTVLDKKGKVLADNLTMAQLEAKDPKTAKFVKEAVAGGKKLDPPSQ